MNLFGEKKEKPPRFWTVIEDEKGYYGYTTNTLAKDVPGGVLIIVMSDGGGGRVPIFVPGVTIKDLQEGTYSGDWNGAR